MDIGDELERDVKRFEVECDRLMDCEEEFETEAQTIRGLQQQLQQEYSRSVSKVVADQEAQRRYRETALKKMRAIARRYR